MIKVESFCAEGANQQYACNQANTELNHYLADNAPCKIISMDTHLIFSTYEGEIFYYTIVVAIKFQSKPSVIRQKG